MRTFWIGFGICSHLLFGLTVVRLFPFLRGTFWPQGGSLSHLFLGGPEGSGIAVDAFLAIQFGVIHSVLLRPGVRERLRGLVPSAQYGCAFSAATCVSLLTTMEAWQPSRRLVWHLHGGAASAMTAGFLLSWLALVYSLSLTGLGYQTGWTPWWSWVRRRPVPRRAFAIRGAYRWLRHPVYLSFLGLVWLTPIMSLDRALLVLIWTGYLIIGSYFKDRRLAHYVGAEYREYQRAYRDTR